MPVAVQRYLAEWWSRAARRRDARDALLSAFAGAVAFFVYVRTMYPDLAPIGDAVKFSFVGKVLGTPHAPGYPLYVIVSHLFSYVPWGSLAHRMNGLSAVLAGITVACAWLACRSLGFDRPVALTVSLCIGFGRAFWSKALYAKTYTLNTALMSIGILMLLEWGRTRRRSRLYWAIAIFALGLGNHLIVIALIPALGIYALATDHQEILSRRTVAVVAALVVLGLGQYLLIPIRTMQRAPYLEARATNARELIDVVTARRWQHEIGAYSARQLVHARVPVLQRLVVQELTTPGLVLAAAGFVIACRRDRRAAALFLIGAAGIISLTANMSSNEDEGFLLPAFILLWVLAGFALQWIVTTLRRLPVAPAARDAAVPVALAVVMLAALPGRLLRANYESNNHHEETFDRRYFNALFDALPDRAAIVQDQYPLNMMVLYKLLGEHAAGDRQIVSIPAERTAVDTYRRAGFRIFVFNDARAALAQFGYEFEAVQLRDVALPEYLEYVPAGTVVAVAATPAVSAQMRSHREPWGVLRVSTDELFPHKQSGAVAVIGVAQVAGAVSSTGPSSANASVERGGRIGSTEVRAAASIEVSADRDGAALDIDHARRATASSGAVLGLMDSHGSIEAFSLDEASRLRVPIDMRRRPLFTVERAPSCLDVGNSGWVDIFELAEGGTLTLRIDDYRPFLSRTVFYIAGTAPAQITEQPGGGAGTSRIDVHAYRPASASERAALSAAAAADAFQMPASFMQSKVVSRVEFDVNDRGAFYATRLDLGMHPEHAFVHATVDLNNPKRATVCGQAAAAPRGPSR